MGQYHGVGESHYRTTTLHNDVLPRLRDNSLWRELDRGLLRGVGSRENRTRSERSRRGLEEEILRPKLATLPSIFSPSPFLFSSAIFAPLTPRV